MRFLLTAFEPFDGTGLNASLEACRTFLERWGSEFEVRFAVLPVAYGPDVAAVEQALAEGPVDFVLHTGQAEGSSAVRIERIAVNMRYAHDDPRDRREQQHRILEDGPAALFSPLPVDELAAAVRESGVPGEVSNHAGIYLCNHALYHSLLRGNRAGFIHVPRTPGQAADGEPNLTANETAQALNAVMRHLAAD